VFGGWGDVGHAKQKEKQQHKEPGAQLITAIKPNTTKQDPISRRYVWDIIQEAKAGRAIVLTTHSMEEADILADRIAIMARGRLKAIGSSIRLKQKYGAGYTLAIGVLQASRGDNSPDALAARAEAVRDFFLTRLGLLPFDEGRCHLHYLVPREHEARLGALLVELEEHREEIGVSDVQLSLTSLEEVFLTIARKAELAAAQATGNTSVEVPLPDGGVLQIAIGQDQGVNPADGRMYAIKWAQDDAGRLVVLDVLPLGSQAAPGLGFPGLDLNGGTGVSGRSLASGLRRRKQSAAGDMKRSRSLTRLLSAGIDLLLGSSKSSDASSGSGHSSSGGLRASGSSGARHRGSSSGGGAAAAELGERGFRVSGGLSGGPGSPATAARAAHLRGTHR